MYGNSAVLQQLLLIPLYVVAVQCRNTHYNDAIMGAMAFQFTQPLIQAQMKENIKASLHWPLCGEFTGDRYWSAIDPVYFINSLASRKFESNFR